MFDDKQHHPQWSFVKGWTTRQCSCAKCSIERMPNFNQVRAPYDPSMWEQIKHIQPYDYPKITGPVVTTTSHTNVKR